MRTAQPDSAATPLLTLRIAGEADIVTARQRARQLGQQVGFNQQDQARLATAVSEIARNAFQYAGGGQVEFSLELGSNSQVLWVKVSDQGPGIKNVDGVLEGRYESRTGMGIGLTGTRRLMDHFSIESSPGQGTGVRFGKTVPPSVKKLGPPDIARLRGELAQERTSGALSELQHQNQEILQTLEVVRVRELELVTRQAELARLNLELEETNRGVVALYAELDEKAAALKRADEMKSQFLRYVSHEFRTPVNSVLALSQLLLRRMDGDLTPEQEKQVEYIRRAVQELAEMVNDLLDLAKVESGKTEIHPSRIELGQLFGSIRALMRPLATNPRVALIFDEPPDLAVESDESKLGQILRNLISNALKFTEHGEVEVSVKRVNGNSVCFSVRDTGVGIAPEHIEMVFQEFAQVENLLQKRVKGTGLGLPLSRKLATLLGGTLTATSAVGSGSTFYLTLPISAAKTAEPQPDSNTILIIDDEETSRYITRQLFRRTQYRILEAPTPAEGTERARFEHPALIFLDLVMPGQNGFDVLDELQADEGTRNIPVVIQTSKAMTAADHERLSSRQATVLPKAGTGRREALTVIRDILKEPDLFREEPEFAQRKSEVSTED